MDGITFDQLNAVFGDLRKSQEAQVRTLTNIQNIVSEKMTNVSDHIVALRSSIDSLVKSTAAKQTAPAKTPATTTDKQQNSSEKINRTINSSFKALASSLLTREGKLQAERKPVIRERKNITTEGMPTKAERQIIRLLGDTNSKTASLLKEVHSQKTEKQEGGGLFKFLSPFLLLFGGVAALTYGAMKIPGVSKFFQSIKSGGIKETLAGLINKIKPQDKSITEWLRGLPLIGRFFDVYDAVIQMTKGNWKQGLKHLAFAIPGAEFLAEIIAGEGAKQKILAPGGTAEAFKNVSLKSIWGNIQKKITGAFESISTTFKEIREIFSLVTTGDQTKMIDGFSKLAKYFPILSPIADVLKSLTGSIFTSSFAKTAEGKVGVGNVKFGDVVKSAMDSVFKTIGKVFTAIGNVFSTAMEVIGSLGDVFSDDYSKQASALNKLDKIAPGTTSMLRQILTIVDEFKNLGITDEMSVTDRLAILAKASIKGATAKVSRFSAEKTARFESRQLEQQAEQEPDAMKKADALKKSQELKLTQYSQMTDSNYKAYQTSIKNLEKAAAELGIKGEDRFEKFKEAATAWGGSKYYEDILYAYEESQKAFLGSQDLKLKLERDISNRQKQQQSTTTPLTLGSMPSPLNQTGIDAVAKQQLLGSSDVDISAVSQTQIPPISPDNSVGEALQSLPFDELSNLKYLPTMAQILKDQNKLITDLIKVNEEQPSPNFTNIYGGPNIGVGTSGTRPTGGRNAFP